MKKTKIICTMGPNSDDREVMKQLLLNGMMLPVSTSPTEHTMSREPATNSSARLRKRLENR